jgi:ubiquinone biosynthesis protein UbiJ
MTRRKHFLSDYERYNPVQNMHALANHVFDLSENVHRISGEVAVSRRMLSIVGENGRDANEQLRVIGEDVSLSRREMSVLKYEVDGIKGEVDSLKADVEGLKGMMEINRREIGDLRRETQQGFAELKGMIAMLVGMRA